MKYTVELSAKQKGVVESLFEIIRRHIGFNPKLEPMRDVMTVDEKLLLDEYLRGQVEGYSRGYQEGLDSVGADDGYTKGYNTAINDYNMMFEWLYDCRADFRKFLVESNYYDDDESIASACGKIMYDLICDHDISTVISEFQKWYEKKKGATIKVGDIVKFNEKCHEYERVKDRQYLVLHIDYDKGHANLLHDSGDTSCADTSLLKKTGKHVDKAEGLVQKLSEVEE